MQDVVITGIGAVSTAGNGIDPLWHAAWNGAECGRTQTEDGWVVGRVDRDQLEPKRYVPRKSLKLVNDKAALGIVAAGQAIDDARIRQQDGFEPFEVGVFSASSINSFDRDFDDFRARLDRIPRNGIPVADRIFEIYSMMVSPMELLRTMASAPQDHTAVTNTFRGSTSCFVGAGTSAVTALREAARSIERGTQRAMVVIGSDARTSEHVRRALRELGRGEQLSRDAEWGCMPYDPESGGSVPAEGAGAAVLESWSSARERGAEVYAVFRGAALRRLDPQRLAECQARAIRAALAKAAWSPGSVDMILGCANGSVAAGEAELGALREIFGEKCDEKLVNLRSCVGDCGVASTLLDVVVAARTLGPRDAVRRVLVNATGEAGEAAALLLEAPPC